jgi:membrane associated rhomboid family serine protease
VFLYRGRDMTWLDKLEKRIGFIAIPGLIRIVVAFNVLVYLLVQLNPDFRFVLALDPVRILHGEVWRLVTYIFLPQSFSLLGMLLLLWFLWFIGEGLERAWGAFRLTLYYLIGMIGTTIAAFFFGSNFSNVMLISSLFYAFARFYPDVVIYLFFILPVKIKWLAWAYAAILLAGFVIGTNSYRMAVVAALSNYLIFFGPEIIHDARHRHEVTTRRRRFEGQSRSETESIHKCAVCGATELSDPNLEFRVARDGEEYCVPHLPGAQTAPASAQDRHPPPAD